MLGNRKIVSDLLSKEEFEEYSVTIGPANVDILNRALKKKIEEEPDYEVWAPLMYYKLARFVKNDDSPLIIQPYRAFVSNKGGIISAGCKNGRVKELSKILISGYYYTPITRSRKQINVLVHRAVASVFVPIGELFKNHTPADLEVNHLDGDKLNPDFTNLEWTTQVGNTQHAILTGLRPSRK